MNLSIARLTKELCCYTKEAFRISSHRSGAIEGLSLERDDPFWEARKTKPAIHRIVQDSFPDSSSGLLAATTYGAQQRTPRITRVESEKVLIK